MSALVEKGKTKEDLGAILARVQDDLQLLRNTVSRANYGAVDLTTLETVLSRTEREIQAASQQVLTNNLNHVTTLPPVYDGFTRGGYDDTRRESRSRHRRRRVQSETKEFGLLEMVEQTSRHSPIHQARYTTTSLNAGEQSKATQRVRLVMEPSLPATRKLLSQQYSLPTTPDTRLSPGSKVTGRIYTGGTIPPLTTLPRIHRKNVMLTPPDISEEDAQRGLLSLIERQLIPPAADIVLNPSPVKSTTLELLSASKQFLRPKIAMEHDACGHMVGVKLANDHMTDHMTCVSPSNNQQATPTIPSSFQPTTVKQSHININIIQPPNLHNSSFTQTQSLNHAPSSLNHTHSTTTTTPNNLQLMIKNGHIVTDTENYKQFKSMKNPQKWTHILAVLNMVENLCRNYAVPMAIIYCSRLEDLSCDHELTLRITKQNLESCLVNSEAVIHLINQPGQRFKGDNGREAAVTFIQATYRMYREKRSYMSHRRRIWAVKVISNAWTLVMKRHHIKASLTQRRCRELEGHRSKSSQFGRRWKSIQESKRVVIHIPSLGHPLSVRGTETSLSMEQSLQLTRIMDVKDPNMEVIYISPHSIDVEILDYYTSLLSLSDDDVIDRIHYITPDHIFHPHSFSLSTLLTLNPRTLQRIKRLTTGREAYIVPGVVNSDDMTVTDILGVPLLGPDSESSELYSSKDGARKLFTDANVTTPPYITDIVTKQQLLDQLTILVANYPLIHRWIFKLPHHTRARGFAYCDVSDHLQCHKWLVRECQRYGEKWRDNRWAQDQAHRRIYLELPLILESHATPVDSDLYPSWTEFQADFLVKGGIIEGHPPSKSVTALTVDMLITPTGDIEILATYDQICAESFRVWGVSLPQSSVPLDMLMMSVEKVGVACKGRGITGHLSIDYVTFIDPTTLHQDLWAVDLDLGYSNHLALLKLLGYITRATFDPSSGQLTDGSGRPRFAVMSSQVYHSNLAVIHYPVFFEMCKAHHIGYDSKENVGTLFALFDREHKDHMGIICIQSSLSEVLSCCSNALTTIHHEISTPLMQGHSNFKVVCDELNMVATLVNENKDEREIQTD